MDVIEAIKSRRSVRAFTDQPVSEEEVEKLIDAARWAPSAGNIQPWEFIVARDPEVKRGLCEAALNQKFIEEAPVVIVVCANPARSGQGYGSRGINLYCLQDTAAATQNILLAAHAMELATCWVGAFKEEKAKQVLNAPDGLRPIAIIPVGHADENPRARPRRSLSDIVHREAFGRK
ncbi:MAG TPA: nitroreductase family protein [Candidatus Bathyarchaeia archaeon]|nr:nitroreductase family protein [Candidatus Bathyarchaeia archaeon]